MHKSGSITSGYNTIHFVKDAAFSHCFTLPTRTQTCGNGNGLSEATRCILRVRIFFSECAFPNLECFRQFLHANSKGSSSSFSSVDHLFKSRAILREHYNNAFEKKNFSDCHKKSSDDTFHHKLS